MLQLPNHESDHWDDPQHCYADISLTSATTRFPDVKVSTFDPPNGHQDHPEEVASGLLPGSPYSETVLVRHVKFRVNRPLTLSV